MTFIKNLIPSSAILFYHKIKAIFAAYYFGFPSEKMTIIGITGTNGKTTSCHLTAKILEEDGHKVGMATTTTFKIGKKTWTNETKMTTLSAWQIQSLLARMVAAKCQYAVIETSSHALVQHRVWGINYDIVAITNVTREHLDYHHTIEEYSAAKEKLFQIFKKSKKKKGIKKVSILNLQDSSWHNLVKYNRHKIYGFSLTPQSGIKIKKYPKSVFIHSSNIELLPNGSNFTINTPHYSKNIQLHIPGKFNIQNALLATCIARSQQIKLKTIKSALEKIDNIPGRMTSLNLGQPFQVIIDYAVTPDSLEKLYRDTIKPTTKNKVIAVLGACGDRDQGKRPIMGEIVSNQADFVILTHEDSWTEKPIDIINMIKSGVLKTGKIENKDLFVIENRSEAIHKALTLAGPGDTVVITGKGAETKMVYPDRTIPWNEKEITENLIKELITPHQK
jgi:UDP-N-acetylmuramoyl-L-alanyl-D-glutamate--2,6-diaminopimelate ligase